MSGSIIEKRNFKKQKKSIFSLYNNPNNLFTKHIKGIHFLLYFFSHKNFIIHFSVKLLTVGQNLHV